MVAVGLPALDTTTFAEVLVGVLVGQRCCYAAQISTDATK